MSDFLTDPSTSVYSTISILVLVVALLYFARNPAHQSILALSRILHSAMRLAARTVVRAQHNLMLRNREVLLASGRVASERIIEREFERMDASIKRELAQYPALHRKMNEGLEAINTDFVAATDMPPLHTQWSKAVQAIAKLPAKNDPVIGSVLDDVCKSMNKAEARALQAYRDEGREHHRLLAKMMPHWRSLQSRLNEVDKNVKAVLLRGKTLDRHMEDYENIQRDTDRAERMLSSSSLNQFFISAFVLAIAVGGAMINFHLIARPMAEMVGGTRMIAGFQIADISALVIILVEISMGLFLMESLRITHLFPVISALNDRMRLRMLWITFSILLVLASVEAGLAFMREILMQEDLATSAHLRGSVVDTATSGAYWITTAAQMGMGFVLPFALVFVAIPLETFVHSLRSVLGILGVLVLRLLASVFRILGNVLYHIGGMLIRLYDLIIFAPLWLEGRITAGRSTSTGSTAKVARSVGVKTGKLEQPT